MNDLYNETRKARRAKRLDRRMADKRDRKNTKVKEPVVVQVHDITQWLARLQPRKECARGWFDQDHGHEE